MDRHNQVCLRGNIVDRPKLTTTANEDFYCEFSIAVDRYQTNDRGKRIKKEVSFFQVVCWRGKAHWCYRNLRKGMCVDITGRLRQIRWKDKSTGEQRSRILVVLKHAEKSKSGGGKGYDIRETFNSR